MCKALEAWGVRVCLCEREREHTTAGLHFLIMSGTFIGLFSLGCQPACGVLCLPDSSGGQVFRTGLIPGQNISEVGVAGRDEFLIAADTEGAAEGAARLPARRPGTALPSLPRPSIARPSLDSIGPMAAQCGCPEKETLSWTQKDTGGIGSCMFPGSLNLAELLGLGHLTVLSTQAGRDNGIFNRLPVCSERKLVMPHFKMVSGGKCANWASKHLIRLLFAHSAGSVKG